MAEELSGEHKLRIVLESIIRNVPKEKQCQKYDIAEEDFQEWHDQLITNGGKILEPGFGSSRTKIRKVNKMGAIPKAVLISSLFANLAAVIVFIVWTFFSSQNPAEGEPSLAGTTPEDDSPVYLGSVADSVPLERENVEPKEAMPPNEPSAPPEEVPLTQPRDDLENLLAMPLPLPQPSILPPVIAPEPKREVSFMGKVYEGKHVVFLLDADLHMLKGDTARRNFESMKNEILTSIASLSPNSYFNLVLFWNLREASALGKTILRANQENKKYAIDWLRGLGRTPEELKENRNQYYPKELLYAKPLPGVVGFWYGLATAIDLDPDLIFIQTGNLPDFNLSEIPKTHFDGLGIEPRHLSQTRTKGAGEPISELIKTTARKWFVSMERSSQLPSSEEEIDDIALQRLGFLDGSFSTSQMIDVPWDESFDHFISGMGSLDMIPLTHTFVSLPPHATLPRSLLDPIREFSENSKGGLVLNPEFP